MASDGRDKVLQVRVRSSALDQLGVIAAREDLTVSDIVRRALREFVERDRRYNK